MMNITNRNKVLCEMYQSGLTIPQISKQSGLSMTQLSRIFRKNKVKRKKYELDKDYFESNKNKTMREISEEVGLPLKRVYHLHRVIYNKKVTRGETDFTNLIPQVDRSLLNDPQWMHQKYIVEHCGAPTIAKLLACKCSDIYNALKRHNISRRDLKTMMEHKRKLPSKEWLEDKYIKNKWSVKRCAREFGCGWDSIYAALKRYGFIIRDASEQHIGQLNEFYGKKHPEHVRQQCAEIGTKAGIEYWSTGDIQAKIESTRNTIKRIWSDHQKRSEASEKITKLCQQGKCNPRTISFISKSGNKISFKSSWEEIVAKVLDSCALINDWRYEYVTIPYLVNNATQHFVVDFWVQWIDGLELLIECKNQHLLTKPDEQLKITILDDYCKKNNLSYVLISDKNEVKNISLGYKSRINWITDFRYKVKRDYLSDPKLFHEIMFHEIIAKITPWHDPSYTDMELENDLARLRKENLSGYIQSDGIHSTAPNSGGMPGRLIIQHFQPHFWHVAPIGRQPLAMAFSDKSIVCNCLRISRDENESLSFERLLREINFHYQRFGRASHFAPGFARVIIKRFGMSGKKIFDPCMGWGGRLIGSYLEGCQYSGCDISPVTCSGLTKIANYLTYDVVLHNASCLNVDWDGDFIFTSPPFYNKEMYIGGNQPWEIYKSRSEWIEKFIKPFISKVDSRLCALYLDKETMNDYESERKFDEIIVVKNRKHARQKDGEEYICVYK